ncbi:MAG: hypothetical protein V1753_04785, partial [Pseudomonadota bacterium]
MIEFKAIFFDGKTSKTPPVTVSFYGAVLKVCNEQRQIIIESAPFDYSIPPPLVKYPANDQ